MGWRRALLLAAFMSATCLAALAPNARAAANGLAPTPPMGWNDWYSVYCGVSAQLVEQTAQAMVRNGMKAAGYRYVNIDDCWMAPGRDSAGNLIADPGRFPQGIGAVAEYVHSLGLELGIYEDAGTATCADLPGSYGHEVQDAATFASWGVDYLKYDRCNIPFGDFPGETEEQVQQTLYTRMSNALTASGRPIVLSMCNPDPGDDPWAWGEPIANLWRTTLDIQDNFGSMLGNFQETVGHFASARPGGWNDPDMLQVGNGHSSRLEYRTEFSLWAEMASPLITSTNLATVSPGALAILENRAVLAVDQDPLGQPGVPISNRNGLWVLTRPLAGGDRAVVLFNSTDTAATIAATAGAVGLPAAHAYRLQDLWSGSMTETGAAISAFVPAHGVAMYRVRGLNGRPARGRGLESHTVLSLTPARAELELGGSTIVRETFADNGTAPVQHLALSLRTPAGWRVRRLGRASAPRLAGGNRFTVAYRVTAPRSGAPIAQARLAGAARYDPAHRRQTASASLAERVLAPVRAPLQSADTTDDAASFGASRGGLAISSRGLGVLAPPDAPGLDSYAALYLRAGARTSSTAQATVLSDPAGGTAGGAGLIERAAMTAPSGSPAGVVLFVSANATIVMAWNASGGPYVDSRFAVPSTTVTAPVALRLIRSGSSYSGYYSTDRGVTWHAVDTVTVAGTASAGDQDVGVFHASGLATWMTTARFRDFSVR